MVWKISDINTLRINHEVQPSFTSDSRFVFIASGTEVKLYNMTSGESVRTLKHIAVVTGICASLTNPTEVYTTSLDGILTVWNYEDGIELVKHNMGEPIIRMKGDQEANTMVVVLKGPASKYFNMRFLDSTKLNKKDEELQFPTYQFSDLGNLSSIDISGSCVAVAARKNLIIWEPSQNIQLRWPSNLIVPNTGRRRRVDLLTVAINPVDDCFLAVGDSLGNIHYLRREQQHRHYISNLQWHSFGTTALKFFMDGTGFLSGGQEGTLLSWELKTYTFKKMGTVGTITQIAISPNDQYAAFTTTENALVTLEISLLRSKSLVEGYKSEHYKTLPSDWLRSPCMKVEPQHGYIALNGAKGYIQFYDVQTDRIVNSFEVVPPNLSAFSGHAGRQELPNPHIDHFAFSSQGTGLALAVYRKVMLKNQHKFLENSLRFYWYSDVDETWLLETRVELPHGDRITNVAYHPQKDIVVSCGEDGRFRVWNRTLIKDKEGSTKVQHGRWVCRSVGNYKTNACSSCAFSPDGSLLAVGYDNMLTLWNPITNILLSEIYHPDCNFIKHILFIADSPYVVTTTQDKLFVWNVLDSSLVWSCEANVFAIAAHPKDPTFAVSVTTLSRKIPSTITQAKDELMKKRRSYVVLFSASSPKPLFTWKVSQDKTPVAMAIGRKDHLKQTGWIILCTTAKQRSFIIEDLSSQTDEEKTEELASLKSEKKLGYLETVMGTDMDEDEEVSARVDSVKHRLMFRRRDQFLSTLAETPSHVLPPMTELFRSYMENVIPKDPNLIEKTEQTQETNEKEKETAATPTVPKKKLEQSQAPTEIPSDSRHLPKQVMELVQLFQGQLVLTDQSADAHPNAGLTSSGKKRNETTQKEASNPLSLSRSASKDLKKKKVDEMQEEPLTNGTTEHKEESVTVGVKRTSEDRIIQGSKKESNGSHSQENEESEGTPKSGRKQALRTSQTKSAPTTPASQPKNQKQNNQTPKSALRQSGSKQKQ